MSRVLLKKTATSKTNEPRPSVLEKLLGKQNAKDAFARRKAQEELSQRHRRKQVAARFHKRMLKVNKDLKREMREKGLREKAEGGA